MTNHEEWNEFLDNLRSHAIGKFRETPEYEYMKKQQEEIDMMFRDNLTVDQKELVEECVVDLLLISDRESDVVYRQGLKDCVWLLKNLGVLA
jgi:hypothetical protein